MSGRWRQAATAGLVAVVLAVMLAIPTRALLAERPARFGWQMYTVAYGAPRAWTRQADGTLVELSFLERFAVLRGDLPDPDAVARAVCRFVPGESVVVELRTGVRGEARCP